MPVMAVGSDAWSMSVSFIRASPQARLLSFYVCLFCCRFGGEHATAEGRSVLTFLQIARRADEIGKGILLGIAVHPRRFSAFLHLLDRLEQRLAHLDDDDVGGSQMLLGPVLNRALRLDREGILRGEMQSHA